MQIRCALVGMPGSGKSSVGRQLAWRTGAPFIDLDQRIEQLLGTSIRNFFELEGEARFRQLESEQLAEVTRERGALVLSTGGGTVLRMHNRDLLRRFGDVLYLRTLPEELLRRIRHDQSRPLLQGGNPLQRLRALYAERDRLYRETAHYVIETGRPSVGMLVSMVIMQLELADGARAAQPQPTPEQTQPQPQPQPPGPQPPAQRGAQV